MRTPIGLIGFHFFGDGETAHKVRIMGSEEGLRDLALTLMDALEHGKSKVRSSDGTRINIEALDDDEAADVQRMLDDGAAG